MSRVLPPSHVFSAFCVLYLEFSSINTYFMHFHKAYILSSIKKLLRYRVTQKNGNVWKTQQKLKKSKKKKFIDRNWTITTCLLIDSNPNYQCLKITSCRRRPPPRMHSFTATTHFKSSRSFVSPHVCCMLCRMRQSRILQNACNTHRVTQKNGNFWNA